MVIHWPGRSITFIGIIFCVWTIIQTTNLILVSSCDAPEEHLCRSKVLVQENKFSNRGWPIVLILVQLYSPLVDVDVEVLVVGVEDVAVVLGVVVGVVS